MDEKNGVGESKPKQSQRQGESAAEMPVGRAYAVESLAVGKVLKYLVKLEGYLVKFLLKKNVLYTRTSTIGWQLSDCGFCRCHLMIKSAIT